MNANVPLAHLAHRRKIRELELRKVLEFIPPKQSIVELGAGAGWQSKILHDLGHTVIAFEIENSNYETIQEWPVQQYDGVHIPLEDNSVDVVFSSNVLEHVLQLSELEQEIERILKPGGQSIHIMPSTTWRLWTIVTFYPKKCIQVLKKLSSTFLPGSQQKRATSKSDDNVSSYKATRKRLPFPQRHGETGNAFSELYYFSRFYWRNFFSRSNLQIDSIVPTGLFYSGHRLFGPLLPFPIRRALSALLGSSCYVYVLSKPHEIDLQDSCISMNVVPNKGNTTPQPRSDA